MTRHYLTHIDREQGICGYTAAITPCPVCETLTNRLYTVADCAFRAIAVKACSRECAIEHQEGQEVCT